MTTTPPPPGTPGTPPSGPDAGAAGAAGSTRTQDGPRVTRDEIRDLGRLRRTTGTQRNIAGVAGGLGRHLDVDPVILRVAFVVMAFFGGAGILLYGACWLLVPDDRSASAPLGLDDRSRSVGLVIAGGLSALALLGTSLGDGLVPFPLIVVAGIALFAVLQLNKRKNGTGAPGGAVAQAQVGTATPYAPVYGPTDPTGPTTSVLPVAPVGWTPSPVRVNPRKRGPILFWFTAALSAVGLGTLGVLDLAGAPIADPAYPALVVGVVGAMLVLGAFWGRAGGLILVGLIATVCLAGSVAVQEIDADTVRATPASAAEVRPTYETNVGEIVLDLRGVADLAALDGRTIILTGDIGHLEVIVPDGLDVTARTRVEGAGDLRVFEAERSGLDLQLSGGSDSSPTAPTLTIDATIGIGEIDIHSPRSFDRPFDRTPR